MRDFQHLRRELLLARLSGEPLDLGTVPHVENRHTMRFLVEEGVVVSLADDPNRYRVVTPFWVKVDDYLIPPWDRAVTFREDDVMERGIFGVFRKVPFTKHRPPR